MVARGAGHRCRGHGRLARGAPIRRRVGPTLLVVVSIFGLGTMVFGLTESYAVAFIALVVISAADMISMYIRGSIVPLVTPDDQLGRVSAVEGVFIGASNELGAFESGVAARAFGLQLAIAGGGFITVGDRCGCSPWCSRRCATSTRSRSCRQLDQVPAPGVAVAIQASHGASHRDDAAAE